MQATFGTGGRKRWAYNGPRRSADLLREGKAMRVVLLVLIVLWPATAQARWVGTAEQWADLQSRDAYGDMGNWFNSLSSKKAGSCCSNFDGRPPEAIV